MLYRGPAWMLPVPLSYTLVTPAPILPSTGSNGHSAARKAGCHIDVAVFEELVFRSLTHELFDGPLRSCVLRLDPNPCDALRPWRFREVRVVSGAVPVDARERLPAPARDHRAHGDRAVILTFDPRDVDTAHRLNGLLDALVRGVPGLVLLYHRVVSGTIPADAVTRSPVSSLCAMCGPPSVPAATPPTATAVAPWRS